MEESQQPSIEWQADARRLLESIGRMTEELARTVGPDGDPLKALRAARSLRKAAEEAVTALVAEARRSGVSWQAIGSALGGSLQAALERARALIGCFLQRRFGELRDLRDDRVRARLGERMLAWLRDTLEVLLGDPLALQGAESWSEGRYQVVDTRVAFVRGVRTMRVAIDSSGLVAGFFLLEPPSGE